MLYLVILYFITLLYLIYNPNNFSGIYYHCMLWANIFLLLGSVCRVISAICYKKGFAKYDLEQYEDSIKYFDKAIFFDSKFASPYYCRGVAKVALGFYAEAIQDLDKVLQLNPSITEARELKEQVYKVMSQNEA